MQPHERDEIAQAILAGNFVPLRLIDGKLQPPPPLPRGLPPGITPEQAQAAYERFRQLSPEERRAERERIYTKYAHILKRRELAR